jgi:hypothetical protein
MRCVCVRARTWRGWAGRWAEEGRHLVASPPGTRAPIVSVLIVSVLIVSVLIVSVLIVSVLIVSVLIVSVLDVGVLDVGVLIVSPCRAPGGRAGADDRRPPRALQVSRPARPARPPGHPQGQTIGVHLVPCR